MTDHLVVPAEHASGIPSRCLRTSCGRWRATSASADRTAASSLRIGVSFEREPKAGRDERGRHAIAGPAEWIAERLLEYVEAGANGFVVNLEHARPGLEERVRRFADEVQPLVR